LSTARVFDVSGSSTPPTSRLRVPVTTTLVSSPSKSIEPVDWPKAMVGRTNAVVAQSSAIFFM